MGRRQRERKLTVQVETSKKKGGILSRKSLRRVESGLARTHMCLHRLSKKDGVEHARTRARKEDKTNLGSSPRRQRRR